MIFLGWSLFSCDGSDFVFYFNCANCNVVSYILEGRVDASSPWLEIGSGDFDWKHAGTGRNARGSSIISSYENVDPKFQDTSTKIQFVSNSDAYLEYKFTVTETRVPNASYIQVRNLGHIFSQIILFHFFDSFCFEIH